MSQLKISNNSIKEMVLEIKSELLKEIIFTKEILKIKNNYNLVDENFDENFLFFSGRIFDLFILNFGNESVEFDSSINILTTRFFDFLQINNISLGDILVVISCIEKKIIEAIDKNSNFNVIDVISIFTEIKGNFANLYNKNVNALLNQYTDVMDKSSIILKINIHFTITNANNEFCILSGYTKEDLIGKPLSYVFCYTDKENCEYDEIIQTIMNKKIRQGIIKNRRKDGTYYRIKSTIVPIIDENDNILEYMSVTIDITDMVLARENIKISFERLQELDAKKDDFINIVSHELRTPMSAMKGYLSMIKEGDMGKVNNEVIFAINKTYESLEGLIEIVNNMFDITRTEKGTLFYDNQNVLITDFLDGMHKDLEIVGKNYSILLLLDLDKTLEGHNVFIDSNKIKQVIINLVSNAFKFSKEFKKVFIKATKVEKRVLIEIIDEGVGIPDDKLKNIFSKFYQVDSYKQRKVEGLGLGLALSQTILKDFGSEVKVKSKIGEGSNFYFYLDLVS